MRFHTQEGVGDPQPALRGRRPCATCPGCHSHSQSAPEPGPADLPTRAAHTRGPSVRPRAGAAFARDRVGGLDSPAARAAPGSTPPRSRPPGPCRRYLVLRRCIRLAGRPLPQLCHAGDFCATSPQTSSAATKTGNLAQAHGLLGRVQTTLQLRSGPSAARPPA
jgi:hypothetical protein